MCKERYHLIDALRGLSVVLMLGYHFGTNLIFFGIASESLIYNPFLNILEPIFAGLFILISGMSCRFSRGNIKRGLITLLCAACVTAVTFIPFIGLNIVFGILHFLGLSMVLYGLLSRFLNRIPFLVGAPLWLVLFIVTFRNFPVIAGSDWFCWAGFLTENLYFHTADYFPLLKWFPLFLLGSQLGLPVKEHKLPDWFYRFNMPFLPFVGRRALIIYLAHQPVFALICLPLAALLK